VLVCGDVINDILVQTQGPLVHGDDNPASILRRPGGSAANQAAWMARLGLDVVFAGRVGARDADSHRRELARFGVRPRLAVDESAATGTIVVLVGPDGERTMITDRGANLRLCPADVPAALLDGVALLHLTGYSFFDPGPREVALGLIAAAAARGVPFTIDPGSAAFLAALEPGAFLAWTRGAAVCFPNRDEAAMLAGEGAAGGSEAAVRPGGGEPGAARGCAGAAAVAEVLARHYGAVAVKLGACGAVLAMAGTPPARIPAVTATVRDTTGAGDAFCAGFLASWLTGAAMLAAARAGLAAAALAVSAPGGRPDPAETVTTREPAC
jgi:sugar/nucleoside kinase (ribokinase family)